MIIFWLVLKLEKFSYRVMISLKDFLEDFLKIIFWHGETFEFSIIVLFP
jgi:hypothetical protein